jgi:4-aminobutyrate aminotransferase
MRRPDIKTELPGPKAAAIIERDNQIISHSLPREYPLVIAKGKGVWVDDPDGNRFLDFTSGIAVCNTGHCHPEVVEAAKSQLDKLIHTCGADFYHSPMVEIAEELASIAPGSDKKRIFLGNSGAEVVEAGFKLARWHSGRQKALAFLGAFHGRTMGALTLTASKAIHKKKFGPLVPGVTHTPYAHCYRCAFNLSYPKCDLACVNYIEDQLFKTVLPPEEVAVMVVEAIQGEGGYIVPPPGYHKRLKALAEKYGILYMVDEIQTGMGRTGKMFAIEHFEVVPDLITSAKGIASGMPLSALIAKDEIMDWDEGSHGSTYGGNPVCCAAGLASIKLVKNGLAANAAVQGEILRKGLDEIKEQFECIGDVRGLGLMQAAEFVTDRHTKTPDKKVRNLMLRKCFEHGLLLLSCGDSTIRFCPPLITTKEQIEIGLEIFADVLKQIAG